MKRTVLLAASLTALSMIASCNTVAGIGKDLQAGGQAISNASDEVADAFTNPRNDYASTSCDPAGRELKGRSRLPPCK